AKHHRPANSKRASTASSASSSFLKKPGFKLRALICFFLPPLAGGHAVLDQPRDRDAAVSENHLVELFVRAFNGKRGGHAAHFLWVICNLGGVPLGFIETVPALL